MEGKHWAYPVNICTAYELIFQSIFRFVQNLYCNSRETLEENAKRSIIDILKENTKVCKIIKTRENIKEEKE